MVYDLIFMVLVEFQQVTVIEENGKNPFRFFREMRNSGVSLYRHFYNVMIDTFGKCNCLDHALAKFDWMRLEGVQPDAVTWNALIDCHWSRRDGRM